MGLNWRFRYVMFSVGSNLTKSKIDVQENAFQTQPECGPMPNVMVALPNIGGALCPTRVPCSNAAKTQLKPLKLPGVSE